MLERHPVALIGKYTTVLMTPRLGRELLFWRSCGYPSTVPARKGTLWHPMCPKRQPRPFSASDQTGRERRGSERATFCAWTRPHCVGRGGGTSAHVRQAVHFLEPEYRSRRAESDFIAAFGPRWDGGHGSPAEESLSLRAAWALVNIWLLGRLTQAIARNATFTEAEAWFVGGYRPNLPLLAEHVSAEVAGRALRSLSRLSFDDDLLELLPYVLELYGPGSRLSIMRDPTMRHGQRRQAEERHLLHARRRRRVYGGGRARGAKRT